MRVLISIVLILLCVHSLILSIWLHMIQKELDNIFNGSQHNLNQILRIWSRLKSISQLLVITQQQLLKKDSFDD